MAPDSQDFRTLISKLVRQKVDGIGLCLNPGQVSGFARQLRAVTKSIPLFGCISFDDANEWKASTGALTDAWYVTGSVGADFRKEYVKRFGNDLLVTGAAVYYDVAKLLGDLPVDLRGPDLLSAILKSPGLARGATGPLRVIQDSDDRYLNVGLVVKDVPRVQVRE